MTHVGPAPAVSRTAVAATAPSFVEWGPVIAGALLAAALSFVLLTFGAAIGLSATSPWPGSGISAKLLAAIAVFWTLVQQIGAFLVGGYIAGRMRNRWQDAPQHETEFRDGLHGGLVWAVGIVIGAMLVMASAGAVARTGAEVAGKAAVSVAGTTTNPMDTVADTLLRPSAPPAGQQGAPAARPNQLQPDTARATALRILASSAATGTMTTENRTYLAQLVAQQTGLSQQEADTRVGNAITATREAVDTSRRAAVLTGLVTALSLVISFAAAWWAALQGGRHRDNAVPARFDFAQRRSTVTTPGPG